LSTTVEQREEKEQGRFSVLIRCPRERKGKKTRNESIGGGGRQEGAMALFFSFFLERRKRGE